MIINKGKLVADGSVEELSKGSGDYVIYDIELEGNKIEEALGKIPNVELKVISKEGAKVKLKITAPKDKELQPEISKLIADNRWTVWNISKEMRLLEDVFRSYTEDKNEENKLNLKNILVMTKKKLPDFWTIRLFML